MNRILTAILVSVPTLVLAACGTSSVGYTKDAARAQGGVDADGNDICASEGWYGDGVCDDFCPTGDKGDCPVSPSCPNPEDPAVHYVSEHDACIAALLACGENQVPFDTAECGCGCIDIPTPGPKCSGPGGLTCPAGFFCDVVACGAADEVGTCKPIPDVCPEIYMPVCGCDGKAYGNQCEASSASVSVAYEGTCDKPVGKSCGGFAGVQCAEGEFCNYPPETLCGAADNEGFCAPIPEACDTLYDPVCACNGQTYSNACAANMAGQAVASEGSCK